MTNQLITAKTLPKTVQTILAAQPVTDMHTHVYSPGFGTPVKNISGFTDPRGLLLWGIDEVLTYHYLVAEVFRVVPATKLPYEQFWKMPKTAQADHIWQHLFVERSPVSEACRGVLTTLNRLGLDPNPGKSGLTKTRKWFAAQTPDKYIDKVMAVANIQKITMTNNVFDDNERDRWLREPQKLIDPRFSPVLRFDTLLCDWPTAAQKLSTWGYKVSPTLDHQTKSEIQRFLREWIDRTQAIYCAVSLPPEFTFPPPNAPTPTAQAGADILAQCILPVLADKGLAFAMMIGCTRGANPALGDAGDMVGKANVQAVVALCRQFPQNKFLVTMLARDNQHELAVATRKFGNLMLFGCWWFLNNPSLIEELTRMRMELLGTSFVPQHSDARVLDQLIYKWEHSRKIISKVLADKYADLLATGWKITPQQIKRDAQLLLQGNFEEFISR